MTRAHRFVFAGRSGEGVAPNRAAVSLLLIPLLLFVSRPASAQERDPAPLTKSEIIRLLSGTTYTESEIEGIVRRSCLSFEPTERDWESFRELGAGDDLVAAIRACGGESLRVALDAVRVEAVAGDTVPVRAMVRDEDGPRSGVRLVLRERDGGAEARGPAPAVSTDSAGAALFRVAAGPGVGTRQLQISASDTRVEGETDVTLVTIPDRPARAELEPRRLEIAAGEDESGEVAAVVRDRFGNPVPDVVVEMHPDSTADGTPLDTSTTDSQGRATLRIAGDAPRRDGSFAVVSGDEVIATLPVRHAALAATDEELEGDDPDERPGAASAGDETRVARELERAAAALQADRAREAARAYESVVRRAPGEATAWLGLGHARVELGREREARRAYRQVLELDPEHEEARQALRRLGGFPAFLELTMWGGDEFESGRGAGLRFARAVLRPAPGLRLWTEYDDALHLNRPALVRGGDAVKGYFAGAALDWGPGDARGPFTTELEVGRRTFTELVQNYYRVEQRVNLSPIRAGERDPAFRAAVGALLGRRFDRDDWQIYSRLELPVASGISLKPSLYVGETMGTNVRETGRSPERERRVYFAVDYRPLESLRIEPSIGAGRVESDADEFSGVLMEWGLRLEVPVTPESRGELYLRHQTPPGTPSFTVLGIGVTVGIDG